MYTSYSGALVTDHSRYNLLIDADDTLWENNIYFERVIAEAQALLVPFGVDPHAFRLHLNQTERRHIPVHGYGTLNFTRSLVETFADHLPQGADGGLTEKIESLALGIQNHPIELLDGVPETLAYLSRRHFLALVTKGSPGEQTKKIERSGLGDYFGEVKILHEKNEDVYRGLLDKHGWNADQTWMIGNSPRSDINPAIGAGMNAVFIPHPHTWVLEHEEPISHPRLIELDKFSDLCSCF